MYFQMHIKSAINYITSCTHMYIYIYIYVCAHIYICISIHTYSYVHMYIYTDITDMKKWMNIHTDIYILYTRKNIYKNM